MTTEEKELWAKIINDARWYDGTPQMLNQLTEHFKKQGIIVKKCSIPDVVGQSEQLCVECKLATTPMPNMMCEPCYKEKTNR